MKSSVKHFASGVSRGAISAIPRLGVVLSAKMETFSPHSGGSFIREKSTRLTSEGAIPVHLPI
jgi:hypothetical protein